MPLTSGNAYKIFKEQLGQQLDGAEKALKTEAKDLSGQDVGELRATFHTIRGGAGFLGFPELANTAKQLEELFKGAADSVVDQFEEIRVLMEKMEALAEDLPPPANEISPGKAKE